VALGAWVPCQLRSRAAQGQCHLDLDLALLSLRSLQEIVAETGIEYDQATQGVVKIYRSQHALDNAARASEFLAGHGLLFERIAAGRCVEIEPALAETESTLVGGVFFARDEVGDCNKFTHGLAEACTLRGVRFHYDTIVRHLDIADGQVRGVMTDKGPMEADIIVVAMGSFTAPLLRKVGIWVPIYPVKGVSVTFDRGAWNSAPRIPVIDDSNMFGFVPIGERMRIAGSAEIAGYDAAPAEARVAAIVEKVGLTFPQIKSHLDLAKARVWGGLRPVTPAGTPIIGETPVDGLWVNSGHGHLGWTLACGSGRVLADLIRGFDPGIRLAKQQGVRRSKLASEA
jgi:D-amino-acid dehydrogenase